VIWDSSAAEVRPEPAEPPVKLLLDVLLILGCALVALVWMVVTP
jgi:hypothetical protein